MAEINIVQAHCLSTDMARAAAQEVADKLAGDYQLACAWQGDVLTFGRSGVNGALTLQAQQAQMVIRLGFPMSAFSAAIETKVAASMKQVFGTD